jgi:hypothetical protein
MWWKMTTDWQMDAVEMRTEKANQTVQRMSAAGVGGSGFVWVALIADLDRWNAHPAKNY